MNDQELKQLWQQQPLRKPEVSPEQLVSAMKNQTASLRRTLWARDFREVAACVLVMIIFGILNFTSPRTPVWRAGSLIIVASSIFIAWKLLRTRQKTPPASAGATVLESLQADLLSVRAQSQLLGSILWWYLLPLGIGILTCAWGSSGSGASNIGAASGYTLFVIALFAFLYWINQYARTKQLLPVEARLKSLIQLIETGESPDDSHIAGLRPMIVSMTAAETARPIEFKIAFYQLAIYGFIGVIGIWLSLAFNSTLNSSAWVINRSGASGPGTSFRAEDSRETNRYFLAARRVVDLFNSGDYSAIQNLYNADMSKAFPPKETIAFYKRLAGSHGRITNFEGSSMTDKNGWAVFRLYSESGEMIMSLALDGEDRISGILFKPSKHLPQDIKNNIKPFLLHLFSWRHLFWAALLFPAGLLYCWLLQKGTTRAVGISSVGIHLQKGQYIIVWNDIKQVRPFKFLNIRSLWLIPETGAKTIMPWTGLERQAELKTAVETFAPANHPIRNYLSLLRTKPLNKNIMIKIILIAVASLAIGAVAFAAAKEPEAAKLEYSDPLSQKFEIIREKHKIPAMASAVVVNGKIVATNAVGFRKRGGPEKVTVDDQFHLGSITKSMTATVAAMLVEQGKISWTTTIGEMFPEFKSAIHPDYRGVTLEQFLSNRGGAPGDAPSDLWSEAWNATGPAAAQRLAFIKGILARKPEAPPGTKYIYSNQGFSIAGVMLERASGETWEHLLRSRLFEPLGMTTAGFGAPASPGKVDQPWGHAKLSSGGEPIPPGHGADNPLGISPANAVHCSLGDLAKYAAFHMAGERGESKLLKAESFKKLHTAIPDNQDYALGWIVQKRPWAKGRLLVHAGSNTMFYVIVWMAIDDNRAIIVASNIGADDAFSPCDEAVVNLINQYFGK
jgi:CubicO group peptidase (beta-lactamase class C family)